MAKDRPGHYNADMSGLDAFRAALTRQEGQFMRGATYIENPVKNLKTADKPSDNERIAGALRDHVTGQFQKKD